MEEVFKKKLNFKEEAHLFSANIPKELEQELAWLKALSTSEPAEEIDLALIFVQKVKDLNDWIDLMSPRLKGDAKLWFAYPKKSSKNYKSEITRDSGWTKIGDYEMEPVRQIALNEDWSALRFRKLAYIKTLSRRESMRLTKSNKS